MLQPIVQPYFPEWRNNLAAPKWVFREGTHIFKVSMGDEWFRLAVPADLILDGLAEAILDAVEFDEDQLYQFSYKNRFGALDWVHHPHMDEGPWTSEIDQTMTFLFDVGDNWEFEMALERIAPGLTVERPVLLEMHGQPPEQYPRWDEE